MCTEGGCGPDPCAGLSGTLWVLLDSDELPWVGPPGPRGPRAEQRPGCPWQCCSSTSAPGAQLKKPFYFQPTRVKSAALCLREELWCCRALPFLWVWRAVPLLPPLTPQRRRGGQGTGALPSAAPSQQNKGYSLYPDMEEIRTCPINPAQGSRHRVQ